MFDLAGKRALIVGMANDQSIAYGCARAFRQAGAEVAVTYQNEKAASHVAPLAEELGADFIAQMDVEAPDGAAAVFRRLGDIWDRLDILLHAVAFCPREDLHARVVDCSREGFARAMDVSVHSFIRLVKLAEPMMTAGGSCFTISYLGSSRVEDDYNIMGPVKAALEASARELASELAVAGIRVNVLSPGPMRTRAASGIAHFDELLERAAARTPGHALADIDDVGAFAAFLASDAARHITGVTALIDGGRHIMA